ncbi:hypothetical protein ACS0TY_024340 [Phlomoides rotata]
MGSPNPSLPPFTVNLSDDSSDGSSPSQRPEGIKKSKMKRKLGEEKSMFLQTIKEENEKLRDILQSSNENKARAFDILERKNEIRQQMSEHQLLMIDPNSIEDLDSLWQPTWDSRSASVPNPPQGHNYLLNKYYEI